MTTTFSSSNTFRFWSSIDLCREPTNGAFGAAAAAASALELCGGGRAIGGTSEALGRESEAAGAGRARLGGAGGEIV